MGCVCGLHVCQGKALCDVGTVGGAMMVCVSGVECLCVTGGADLHPLVRLLAAGRICVPLGEAG